VAAVIGYIELKQAVGIGPYPTSNGSLESNFSVCVVSRVSVVREKRNGNGQKAHNQEGNHPELICHGDSPYFFIAQNTTLCCCRATGAIPTISDLTPQMNSLYTWIRSE
jgi:hypothetical protein